MSAPTEQVKTPRTIEQIAQSVYERRNPDHLWMDLAEVGKRDVIEFVRLTLEESK